MLGKVPLKNSSSRAQYTNGNIRKKSTFKVIGKIFINPGLGSSRFVEKFLLLISYSYSTQEVFRKIFKNQQSIVALLGP